MISNYTDPFGFSSSEVSFVLLPFLFFAVIGAISIGLYIDATKKYKFALTTVTAMLAISWSMLVFTLYNSRDNKVMFFISLIVSSVLYGSFHPLCFSFGSELTFPL